MWNNKTEGTVRFLLNFIVTLILTNLGFISCKEEDSVRLPNIILCMADDQGWGDVGCYGHPVIQTPNLDDMAASGLRFSHFYAAAPVCSPTRGSVLTGRHPNRFGCFSWGYTLRPQEITIAEALKTAGYVTGHFGKWHLGSIQEGSPVNPRASGFDEWFSFPNFFDNNPILSKKGKAIQTEGESSMVTMDAAIEFIQKYAGRNQPIFTVIWFGSPHLPYKASIENSTLYAGQPPQLANYYEEITGIDRTMGKLRESLKTLGIADNTLLWYCSDNGGYKEVSNSGGRGYKSEIYEGGLQVPSIIEWPSNIKSHRITKIPSSTVDIYPTLLEITGVKIEEQPVLDGISLLPTIQESNDLRSKPIGFWQYPIVGEKVPGNEWMVELLKVQKSGNIVTDSTMLDLDAGKIDNHHPEDSFPGHAAWLDWPYKLHRIHEPFSGKIKIELYNIEKDSLEQKNLSSSEIEKVELMLQQLEAWEKSVAQSLNGKDYK